MSSETPSISVWGGALTVNCLGVAGCWKCGWRGVPPQVRAGRRTDVDQRLSTFCPSCERTGLERALRRGIVLKAPTASSVRRNAPCPCGSGKKAKKCCHR